MPQFTWFMYHATKHISCKMFNCLWNIKTFLIIYHKSVFETLVLSVYMETFLTEAQALPLMLDVNCMFKDEDMFVWSIWTCSISCHVVGKYSWLDWYYHNQTPISKEYQQQHVCYMQWYQIYNSERYDAAQLLNMSFRRYDNVTWKPYLSHPMCSCFDICNVGLCLCLWTWYKGNKLPTFMHYVNITSASRSPNLLVTWLFNQ